MSDPVEDPTPPGGVAPTLELVTITQANLQWAVNENMRRIIDVLRQKLLDRNAIPLATTANVGSLEDVGYPTADDHAVPLAFLFNYIATNLP